VTIDRALDRLGDRRLVRAAGDPVEQLCIGDDIVVAGFGMVLSGLYPTDPGGAPTTNERVHSLASGAASVALIGAVALAALVPWSRVPRRATGAGGLLAFIVLILGVASPILHDTDWTGLSQRLLWAALMAWLLVNAWKLAR
jgi:hypothetical protein